ncbi:MAG: hypothetical protein ABEJ56_00960 [Candidatus Nanohaloarchaea archaeon]
MSVTVESFRDEFEKVKPVLMQLFDVESGNLIYEEPDIETLEEFDENRDPEEESVVFYDGNSNKFVVNERYDETDCFIEINESNISCVAGEECVHWLRQSLGAAINKFMDIPKPSRMEIVEGKNLSEESIELANRIYPDKKVLTYSEYKRTISQANTEIYMKGCTVDEFVGRLGGIVAAEAFAGEVVPPDLESWDLEESSFIKSRSCSEVRRKMWNENLERFLDELDHFWDEIAHLAGYRAADENYEDAIDHNGILAKSPVDLWNEYNLSRYEEEAIRELR